MNAGSVADIAFLLLIFFLVTTTIQEDRGVLVRLAYWDDDPPVLKADNKNTLTVQLNAANDLLVEEKAARVRDLPILLRDHVRSPQRTPKTAIVSLIHDRGTSYQHYLRVYDALLAGYHALWDDAAHQRYGVAYADLSPPNQRDIRRAWPMVISEAEPSEY